MLVGIGLDRELVMGDAFSLVVSATAISMALTPGLALVARRFAPVIDEGSDVPARAARLSEPSTG